MPIPPLLPRLAFGESMAHAGHDLAAFLAAQRTVMPSIRRYEPLGDRGSFAFKSALLEVNGLRLAASSSTPLSMAASGVSEKTLLIPLHGWSTTEIDGRTYRWEAGRTAMLVPGGDRSGESGTRSTLAITFDPGRLQATAGAMAAGTSATPPDLRLDEPRLVPLRGPGLAAATLLARVLTLIDLGTGTRGSLSLHAIDDMIYRALAGLLAPLSLKEAVADARTVATGAVIDRVAEHITAHLQRPIALTELESLSGLSARSLQVAFRGRYGCSPRTWMQQGRLDLVRARLLAAGPGVLVASVAVACGFTRLGAFARSYAARFGEYPSETLARGQSPR